MTRPAIPPAVSSRDVPYGRGPTERETRELMTETERTAQQAAAVIAEGRITDLLQQVEHAQVAYRTVRDERDGLRKAQGALYRERAHLTAFLAACYPSVRCPDRDDDEYELLYVTTPDGQMSWHVHVDDAAELLSHVPEDEHAEWDGHTTEEKYRRLEALVRSVAHLGPPAQVDASIAERERDEARSQAEAFRDAADFERNQVIALRALLAEVLRDWEHDIRLSLTPEVRARFAEFRERAGIDS